MHQRFPWRSGRLAFAAMLLSLLAWSSGVQVEEGQPEESTPARIEELQGAIRRVLEETNTPGAGIALVTRDSVIWVGGVGLAHVEAETPVTGETLFRQGSISKSFVSLSVLLLQERGRLSLDDRVSELAPEIEFENRWEESAPLRLVHLLEHTSGFDDIHLTEYVSATPTITLREALDYHPDSRTSRWEPGTHFSYSNSGPAFAAYVVEEVAGQPFEDFVQANLFDPLGMTTASFFLTDEVEEKLAKGYGSDGVTELPYWHIGMRPSGAVNASAQDMAGLLQFFLNRGTVGDSTLLSPASLERMETPGTTLAARAGMRAGYGLGNFTSARGGFLFHGHDGGMNAYLASYGYMPDAGVGYAVMINRASRALSDIRKLVQRYLVRDLEAQVPPVAEATGEAVATITGYYEPLTPRVELSRFIERFTGLVQVYVREGRPWIRPALGGEGEELIPVAEGQFRGENDPVATVAFIADGDGRVIAQGFGDALVGNYGSIPVLRLWLRWILLILCVALMASSVAFALVWVPRKLLGRLRGARHLSVRTFPLLAVLSLVAGFFVLMLSMDDPIVKLGRPTALSVGFFLLTLVFAAATLTGLVQVVRARKWEIHRGVWLHALLVSLANTAAVLYLSYWGVIGLRPWSY
ncbi:MAG: beta-lactamase family protein [Gemmatimonadota bacterium]|nr:MAG: beta-lactamase family protein [Gemmatimonadota bacterium]